jgi:hypothetical protein
MSTQLRNVPDCHDKFELQQTRFYGGINRGVCLELTQFVPNVQDDRAGVNTVQLTKDQARSLAVELLLFAAGREVEI